jgi:Mn2+/Fe2+ NRAMP family transporter
MAEQTKGLPMTSKWDPERLAQEVAVLQGLERKPFLSRIRGYTKLTGPAWLQSAMTLGAGSAAASVMAGASFRYDLLWVQPVAMFLGVMMMAALGNVVLSTGERPYGAVARETHVSIAFLWGLGTIVASIIWHFPQYGLASAMAWDLAQVAGVSETSSFGEYAVRIGAGLFILSLNIFTTWNYGSGSRGIKLYETFIRWVIRIVILAFAFVVLTSGTDWGAVLKGFCCFRIPAIPGSTEVILGAIGASVGINMTFLYPYSLLAKGWGKHHKGLSRWDLFSSMFLPFVLVTSLIIIGSANSVYDPAAGKTLMNLKPVQASQGLTRSLGPLGRIIFDLGFFGMTCSAISTHMVVCGFTVCEMFGLEYTVKRYRLCTLVPVVGILGVMMPAPLWMPIMASAICLTMLPIAYITFFVLNNKRSYLGDAVGRGWKRLAYNAVLVVAIAAATIGAGIKIKTGVVDKLFPKAAPTAPAPAPKG